MTDDGATMTAIEPTTLASARLPDLVPESPREPEPKIKIRARNLTIRYGEKVAVRDVNVDVEEHSIMAFIGPSGCGKSTILRSFDRMNDLIPGARVEGSIVLDGIEVNGRDVQPVALRRKVGLVFQRPN